MQTKTVYLFDNKGYYAGPYVLNERTDKTPVTKDWIIPANSTEVPMTLEPKAHYLPHWSGTDWEYVEDKNNPPEPEPPVPTPEEEKAQKIAALDSQYEADKQGLINAYVDATLHDDTELMDSIKAEMADLDAQYDEDYRAIMEED